MIDPDSSLRSDDRNFHRGLNAAIGLLVVLGIGFAVFAGVSDLPDVEWDLAPGWAVLGVLGFAVSTLFNAELWRRVLSALGPRLPVLRCAVIWCTSALGRYVPTGLLVPVMRVAMAERDGVRKEICIASIAYELVLMLTSSLLVGAYLIIDLPSLGDGPQRFGLFFIPVLAIVAIHPTVFQRAANFVLDRLGRPHLTRVLGFGEALGFLGLYALNFVVAGLAVFALAHLAYPVSSEDLPIVVAAYAASNALSLLAFIVPAGIVAREAALVLALSPIMPSAPALAIAIVARIVQLAVELVLAAMTSMFPAALKPGAN